MTYSFKGQIPASSVLSKNVQDAHLFKDFHSASLVSLRKLFDDGCTAILDKNELMLSNVLNLVLSGKIKQMNGLWYIPLSDPEPLLSNFWSFDRQIQLFVKINQKYLPGIFTLSVLVQL